jgi:predicted TIM-barrel fold metal-dependent hydrolase
MFKMPAQYMFKDIPETGSHDDFIQYTIEQMDKYHINQAMIGFHEKSEVKIEAAKNHTDRFFFDLPVNPNIENEAENIKRHYETYGIKAVSAFPSGMYPQIAINDQKWHPIYEMCIELDIPFFCCVGVPGPRIPMAPQKVELIDEVCWYFPELKFIMRHGAEPWTALACKLMLKYPNLYYSTSAFSPKHYPKDIIDFANTRGKNKIMYAGYFPMGLSLDKIFTEMGNVPFNDEIWPLFLGENAKRVLKLKI